MRYDAEHKARTRTTLLAEAAKAFRAEGPHKAGVAEIMARAGLTPGGFYAHFDSKDAMIAAAIGCMFEESLAAFERGTSGQRPACALDVYIRTYLSERHRDARETGCPLASLAADLPRLGKPASREFAAGYAALSAAMSNKLAALDLPEPEKLASSVLGEMVGALSLARCVADSKQSSRILAASRDSLRQHLGLCTRRAGAARSARRPGKRSKLREIQLPECRGRMTGR
jgi:TetR/AcrR family transcriptional repressor of nem operon